MNTLKILNYPYRVGYPGEATCEVNDVLASAGRVEGET